jgi:hypothetical protein
MACATALCTESEAEPIQGQRDTRTEIAQRAEPAGLLADLDHARGDDARRLRNEIAGGVADIGSILERARLQEIDPGECLQLIDAAEARMGQSDVSVEMQLGRRRIVIGDLDAVTSARPAEGRVAGVSLELILRVEIEPPEADRRIETVDELRPRADLGAARLHQQRDGRDLGTVDFIRRASFARRSGCGSASRSSASSQAIPSRTAAMSACI